MASRFPIRISRRRMLAASGATVAAGALAACGSTEDDEDVSPEREAELLRIVLAEQTAVLNAIDEARDAAPESLAPVVERLSTGLKPTVSELAARAAELTEEGPTDPASRAGQAESAVEGLKLQLEQAIAGSIDAIGELPPEPRAATHRVVILDAAALAAIRNTLGEEIAPDAFVMGPPSDRDPA